MKPTNHPDALTLPGPYGPHPPDYTDTDPGPTLGARDLRANPSSGQREDEGLDARVSRDDPAQGGAFAPPMHDASIQSYDLKTQLGSYDAMAGEAQLPPYRPEGTTR